MKGREDFNFFIRILRMSSERKFSSKKHIITSRYSIRIKIKN